MATIHSIHGFNVEDEGHATTDTLTPLFLEQNITVFEHNYPEFFRLRVRLCNKAMATMMRDMIEPGDSVVGHSNGCAIIYLAAKVGARFRHVTLINPALDSNLAIPGAESVDVWYSPTDPWTNLAQYIPFSIWGCQGRVGYTGNDVRYRQFDEDKIFHAEVGHSGVFSRLKWRREVVDRTLDKVI